MSVTTSCWTRWSGGQPLGLVAAIGLLVLGPAAAPARAEPFLLVSASSGAGGNVEASSLGLSGATQLAGRAYSGTQADQLPDGADAAVFEGLLNDCDAGCGMLPGFGRSKGEVDPVAGTLRALAFSAANDTGAFASAGLSDVLTFSPRDGFGADVYVEFDIGLDLHAFGDVEAGGSALGAFWFGATNDVDDWRFLLPGEVEGYFSHQRSQYSGFAAECIAVGAGDDESCTADGRYTVVLPGMADGIEREFFFLLSMLAECSSNECEALADAEHTVHMRILNPYVSASGYQYDGAPGEGEPIPEPAALGLLVAGIGAALARARRPRSQ